MVTRVDVNQFNKYAAPSSQTQYLRKIGLVVSNGPGSDGIDLSNMRIRFRTFQADLPSTPNHTEIRVFNLSAETANKVQKEFTSVHLDAGYEGGPYGVVFDGTIKMVRQGRINQTDTYLDILAADGDIARNFATISQTLAAGSTTKQQLDTLVAAMGIPPGYVADIPPAAAQRGKVLYGMVRDRLDDLSRTQKSTWSIQNGQVQYVPETSYVPGEAVVLNAQTGMIGLPEQTEEGIRVSALLNPRIKIGSLVQIDNKSIQRAFLGGINLQFTGRLETIPGLLPKVNNDWFYRVYVAEYYGDNRGVGSDWRVDMTCLSVDKSAPEGQQVAADG